jgi:predicted ATPase
VRAVNFKLGGQGTKAECPARGNVAWFGLIDPCAKPLSAPDFPVIAERFAAVIVEGIPQLARDQRNKAQRYPG